VETRRKPGAYDEMSPRSFPDYPGGTSLQRLAPRSASPRHGSEGFTVYESEWWHFDYKDWPEYPILNVPFESSARTTSRQCPLIKQLNDFGGFRFEK